MDQAKKFTRSIRTVLRSNPKSPASMQPSDKPCKSFGKKSDESLNIFKRKIIDKGRKCTRSRRTVLRSNPKSPASMQPSDKPCKSSGKKSDESLNLFKGENMDKARKFTRSIRTVLRSKPKSPASMQPSDKPCKSSGKKSDESLNIFKREIIDKGRKCTRSRRTVLRSNPKSPASVQPSDKLGKSSGMKSDESLNIFKRKIIDKGRKCTRSIRIVLRSNPKSPASMQPSDKPCKSSGKKSDESLNLLKGENMDRGSRFTRFGHTFLRNDPKSPASMQPSYKLGKSSGECLNDFEGEIMDKERRLTRYGRSVLRSDRKSPASKQLHDKLCKSSGKNSVKQIKRAYVKFTSEKLKNKKTCSRINKKIKKQTEESHNLIVKSPQLSSESKTEQHQKCVGCLKTFGNSALRKSPHSNCKSAKRFNNLKNRKVFSKDSGRTCEKCHFKCINSFLFQEHDCEKVLESMKRCAVWLNNVKMHPVEGINVIRECKLCNETFDQQLTDEHFEVNHPGESSSVNFEQYYLNLNPVPSNEPVVVRTEPVTPVSGIFESDVQEPDHNTEKTCIVMLECERCNGIFDEDFKQQHLKLHHTGKSPCENYLIKTERGSVVHEFNPVLCNTSVPPSPASLPTIQSSVSLFTGQLSSPETGESSFDHHSASESATCQSPPETGEQSFSHHSPSGSAAGQSPPVEGSEPPSSYNSSPGGTTGQSPPAESGEQSFSHYSASGSATVQSPPAEGGEPPYSHNSSSGSTTGQSPPAESGEPSSSHHYASGSHLPSGQIGEPSSSHQFSSRNARFVNPICNCVNRNVGEDNKPCLKCLSELHITAPSAQSGATASNIPDVNRIGLQLVSLGWQLLDAVRSSVTFNGFRPPSTPSTLIQEPIDGEPCSTPEVGITSLNEETSTVLDLSKND